MKFNNTKVMNFEGAFKGLRNPLESWKKSDSRFGLTYGEMERQMCREVARLWAEYENEIRQKENKPPLTWSDEMWNITEAKYINWLLNQGYLYIDEECADTAFLGPNDLTLAKKMIKAGSSDRKFLRQIMVSVDITGPLYWWKEFDTYKIGTTSNSTSTMHKLASTPITMKCFEMDDYESKLLMYEREPYDFDSYVRDAWESIICDLETLRKRYNETQDKKYWKELIRLLPESWLQTRTVTMNYEVLRNIYSQRKNHRLSEWHKFCNWVNTLPYADDLILYSLDKNKKL